MPHPAMAASMPCIVRRRPKIGHHGALISGLSRSLKSILCAETSQPRPPSFRVRAAEPGIPNHRRAKVLLRQRLSGPGSPAAPRHDGLDPRSEADNTETNLPKRPEPPRLRRAQARLRPSTRVLDPIPVPTDQSRPDLLRGAGGLVAVPDTQGRLLGEQRRQGGADPLTLVAVRPILRIQQSTAVSILDCGEAGRQPDLRGWLRGHRHGRRLLPGGFPVGHIGQDRSRFAVPRPGPSRGRADHGGRTRLDDASQRSGSIRVGALLHGRTSSSPAHRAGPAVPGEHQSGGGPTTTAQRSMSTDLRPGRIMRHRHGSRAPQPCDHAPGTITYDEINIAAGREQCNLQS